MMDHVAAPALLASAAVWLQGYAARVNLATCRVTRKLRVDNLVATLKLAVGLWPPAEAARRGRRRRLGGPGVGRDSEILPSQQWAKSVGEKQHGCPPSFWP